MSMDDDLRARIRSAFADAGPPHPAVRVRVMAVAAAADPRGGWRRVRTAALGGVALLIAVAVVAGLVVTRVLPGRDTVPAATGSPAGSLRMETTLGFQCTLPAGIGITPTTIGMPAGALTTFPSVRNVSGLTYAGGRWVAAPASHMSPNGRSYAYTTSAPNPGQGPIHSTLFVQDATGGPREVWHGAGYAQVLGWTAAGIYFTNHDTVGEPPIDVLLVDPAHPGAARRVGPDATSDPQDVRMWLGVSPMAWLANGGVWTTSPGPDGSWSVARMDLTTGHFTTWYRAPAGWIVIIAGLDRQGRPLLDVAELVQPSPGSLPVLPPPGLGQLLLLTAPDRTETIAGAGSEQVWTNAVSDSHGTWIASADALWLYADGRLLRVGTVPPHAVPAGVVDGVPQESVPALRLFGGGCT